MLIGSIFNPGRGQTPPAQQPPRGQQPPPAESQPPASSEPPPTQQQPEPASQTPPPAEPSTSPPAPSNDPQPVTSSPAEPAAQPSQPAPSPSDQSTASPAMPDMAAGSVVGALSANPSGRIDYQAMGSWIAQGTVPTATVASPSAAATVPASDAVDSVTREVILRNAWTTVLAQANVTRSDVIALLR